MNSAAPTSSRPAGAGAFTYFDNKSNTLSGQIPAGMTITLQTSEAYNTSVLIADGTTSCRDHRPGPPRGDRSSQRSIGGPGTFTTDLKAGGAVQTDGGNGGTRYLDGHIVSQAERSRSARVRTSSPNKARSGRPARRDRQLGGLGSRRGVGTLHRDEQAGAPLLIQLQRWRHVGSPDAGGLRA